MIHLLPKLLFQEYLDQAVHNKVLRTQPSLPVHILPAGDLPIAHLAVSTLEKYQMGNDNILRSLDGLFIPVVHQYDRHLELKARFLSKLSQCPVNT